MKYLVSLLLFFIPFVSQAAFIDADSNYGDPVSTLTLTYTPTASGHTGVILILMGGGDRLDTVTANSLTPDYIGETAVGGTYGYAYCYENMPSVSFDVDVTAISGGDAIEVALMEYSDSTCDTFVTSSGSGSAVSDTIPDNAAYGARSASTGPPSSVAQGTLRLTGSQQLFADGTIVEFTGTGSITMYGVKMLASAPPGPSATTTITVENSFTDAVYYLLTMVFNSFIIALIWVMLFNVFRVW